MPQPLLHLSLLDQFAKSPKLLALVAATSTKTVTISDDHVVLNTPTGGLSLQWDAEAWDIVMSPEQVISQWSGHTGGDQSLPTDTDSDDLVSLPLWAPPLAAWDAAKKNGKWFAQQYGISANKVTSPSAWIPNTVEKTPAKPKPEPEPEVLTHLDPVTTVRCLSFDAEGNAKRIDVPTSVPMLDKARRSAIKDIAKQVGHAVVGRGRTRMTKHDKGRWLEAWHNGDMRTCFHIESAYAQASSEHPGHPDSPVARVFWQSTVAGELPPGKLPPGNWPSPLTSWTPEGYDSYLVAAKMRNPQYLTNFYRSRWVTEHIKGNWRYVEELSLMARARRREHGRQPVGSVSQHDLPAPSPYQGFLGQEIPVSQWPIPALYGYLKDFQLVVPAWAAWIDLVDAVETFHKRQSVTGSDAYTLDDDQPALSGYHRKLVLRDGLAQRWLFKPASDEAHHFRPEAEHEAHILARAWGYRTALSRLITFTHDGRAHYGQVQQLFTVKHSLAGWAGADFAKLSLDQLCALAQEHILDWAIDNDDSHGDNILVLDNGALIGIDKGRAWRYFGGWDGLSGDSSANSNAPLVYTALYQAIAGHHLDKNRVDAMYRAVLLQARRMQRLPDARLAEIITRAVVHRPHFRPSSYQKPFTGAPSNAAELIAAATSRKNQLADDMTALWSKVYARAGWSPPELSDALGWNRQGHPLHSGLFSPELYQAISRSKSYGTPAFVAGTDIEDAHILLWRELRPDGHYNIRGTAKVRGGEAADLISQWCDRHRGSAEVGLMVKKLPAARAAAKTDPLGKDGELVLSGEVLAGEERGQVGSMFLITLPTGEQIEFRGWHDTHTPLAQRGLLQFTIPDTTRLAESLHAVVAQFAAMGLTIVPADAVDLELFYWRHLAGVMADRCDSRPGGIHHANYKEFWGRAASRNQSQERDAEIAMWRHAFTAIVGGSVEHVENWVAQDRHLPRFMHLDMRNPQQPCGRPYWERLDVPREAWQARQMPALHYRSGARWPLLTGACMSTETRMQVLAIWRSGQSSLNDMGRGSSAYVFTRLNRELHGYTIYFNPRTLIRTHTYGFDCDHYGQINERRSCSRFNFDQATQWVGSTNETLIKNALSVLDDVELIVFSHQPEHLWAIQHLEKLGVREIRGVPVTARLVLANRESLPKHVAQVRESFTDKGLVKLLTD